MRKIIFVGLHNKPGKLPLCGSTKSGKLINRIINEGGFTNVQKTNLFDLEYYPANDDENFARATMWWDREKVHEGDIIVLLGAAVHTDFVNCPLHEPIIKVAHPASKRSHVAMNEYVLDCISKLNSVQNAQVSDTTESEQGDKARNQI